MTIEHLRCENVSNPLGIEDEQPRLGWQLASGARGARQVAYRVLVASQPELLAQNEGDLWDSGQVDSDETSQIAYAGKPLSSHQRAYWKVSVVDEAGRTSESETAFWETGLLQKSDWHGQWIGYVPAQWSDEAALTPEVDEGEVVVGPLITAPPAPYLRHTFTLSGEIKRATAYICGLGLYEMSLNGRKVGDHVLDPAWTHYDRRSLYVAHDVTDDLKNGRNAVGVILGTGHYNDHVLAVWDFENASWRAHPKMLLEMRVDYEDGRHEIITSNDSWKASIGPILFDSISGGERYDARLEKTGWDSPDYNDADWEKAQVVEPVPGVLVAQTAPPIKDMQVLTPVKVSEPTPGVWIFDMGQNFAGVPQLHVSGAAGTKVVMRCAEKLHEDGTLDASNLEYFLHRRNPEQLFQNDSYILNGQGNEVWQPRFTYHGFQYIEVTGFPGTPTLDNMRGLVQHSAFDAVGSFECSNAMLNRTQHNAIWAYISNFHGYPSDCPHREKNGWMGDAHLAAEMGLYNFDGVANYERWLDDIREEQTETGVLPGIVPTSGWGLKWGNGPAWDSAYPLIAWYLYLYHDDKRILAKHYDGLKLYVDYVTSRSTDGIVGFGLDDWVAPKTKTPVEVTDTGYYYADTRIVAQIAEILGKSEDARHYSGLAASIKTAFNAKFYDSETHLYATGSLTAQSCALYQDLVPEANKPAVVEALIAEIENQGYHMDVGILGAKYILNALAENGRADVAYQMLMQKTWPSYGYWIEQNATTLWEEWNGDQSRNHIMFGDVSAWFYKYLAGIQATSPGFKTIRLQPHILGDLTAARATYNSAQGTIVSDWKLENGTFHWQVTIPANTTATVMVPCAEGAPITENGCPIAETPALRYLRREQGTAVYAAEAGSYSLACTAS